MIELILKDRNEKPQFVERCKITINSLLNLLLVEPLYKEFKVLSASFKSQFVSQENILFVFGEHELQDFALIFNDTKKFKKSCDFLHKNGATLGSKKLIHERFLPFIFKHISKNNDSKMKDIIVKWIKLHENGKEKEEYIQLLKNYKIYDFMNLEEKKENNQRICRKRKAKDISYGIDNGIKWSIDGYDDSQHVKLSKRLSVKTDTSIIIEAPNFKLLKYFQRGVSKIKLSIFASPEDQKFCYDYSWKKAKKYFICHPCSGRKTHLSAKIIKKRGKDAVLLNNCQHVCEPRIYKRIIEKPNFEFVSYHFGSAIVQRLLIFSDSTFAKCYEYLWSKQSKLWHCCGCLKSKHWTAAEICQTENGEDFVMLNSGGIHVCEMIQYNPEKYIEKQKISDAPEFRFFENIVDGVDRSRLVVFTTLDKTNCYEYFRHNTTKGFRCNECSKKNKHVAARVYQNSDGSNYLKFSKYKHVCEPCEFVPEKFEMSDEMIESSDFKVFNYKHNGILTSRLVLFCSTNKNLCYEYYRLRNQTNSCTYVCCYCSREKWISATLFQNGGGKGYLKLCKEEHICELREFDPDKYKDDAILKKSMYEITTVTKDGTPQKLLYIFTSEEKKFYYKFLFRKDAKHFYCSKCRPSNLIITAVIQNEGSENECIFISNQKHICEPFESPTTGNIIMAPEYQVLQRKFRGKILEKLVIFSNESKTECFEYSWHKSKTYICRPCCRHHIHVLAKIIIQNGEECVQLSEKQHKCKPIKYVPENITTAKIVKLPNYQLLYRKFNGKLHQHLIVFTNDEKSECFEYSWSNSLKTYSCQLCRSKHKKYVYAKIFKNDESEDCVEFGKAEHQCQPIKYVPENIMSAKIVKSPNFKLSEIIFRNKKAKRLTIFDLKNKNYGYIYSFNEERKFYVCMGCNNKKINAKVLEDENGQSYLELSNVEHVCEIRKIET